jgi:hypothetical protein
MRVRLQCCALPDAQGAAGEEGGREEERDGRWVHLPSGLAAYHLQLMANRR